MAEFATFDGIELHYEEEGAGPPVVLLHGLSSSIKGNWRDPGIWSALVDSGKRVIGLDARGHGRSAKPHDPSSYRDRAMVRDVGAFFDHLGLERTDLVGYSMGAATAIRFAVGEPRLRRLVLGGIGGVYVSIRGDFPSGAAIVCTFGALLIITSLIALVRPRVTRA